MRKAHSGDARFCYICRIPIKGKEVYYVQGHEVGPECHKRLSERMSLRPREGKGGGACKNCGVIFIGRESAPCVDECCLCCSSRHKQAKCPLEQKVAREVLLTLMGLKE